MTWADFDGLRVLLGLYGIGCCVLWTVRWVRRGQRRG
jgi:hypothetical protein